MKNVIKTVAALAALTVATPAWSLLIDAPGGALHGTDVGSIDTVVGQTANLDESGTCGPGSSEATEECWAEWVSGESLSLAGKTEDVDWYNTDQANVIAFALAYGPGFYIVKNSTAWVLLENLANLDWGVLNLGGLDVNLNLGSDMQISHVTEFNGGGETRVPEPGTLALFGLGILGAGLVRRRRRIA